ncbi:SpvB/TcaC N-terminal domain-containing protein [Mucilaginibacter sp.]|uniref:SpvB/TcaC N-terminal domain-containing protein n=1 Tax=Mucilaginibacter sp. TaxID=1882438 RepID=UPI00326751B5
MKFNRSSKEFLVLFIALMIPFVSKSQVDKSLENLRNLMPPSPNASSLGRYSEWPVSLYTGVPNISIPIYEVKGRSIKLPIDISYHASGNRVGDIASWVGLGWNLNAGGMISRSVRNLPDEDSYFSYANNYTNPNDFTTNTATAELYKKHRTDAADNNGDSQQDIYTLSAMGKSYRLLLKADGSVTTMPYSNLKITYSMASSWTVIMEDGTTLLFGGAGGTESNNNTRYGNNAGGIAYNSSWLLKTITSPVGEIVNFSYSSKNITQDTHFTESDAIEYKTGDNSNGQGGCSIITNTSRASKAEEQQVTVLSLTTIETDLTRVEFIPSTIPRTDLNGGVALSEIKVFSKFAGKYIDDYLFNYTFSQASLTIGNEYTGSTADPSYFRSRLRLVSLKRQAPDNSAFQLWSFQYNPLNLPSRRSYAQDHMGYYNGATSNTTLLPAVFFALPGSSFWTASFQYSAGFVPSTNHLIGGKRIFNGDYMQAEMLTKIIYPTGGSTQFNYEPNSIPVTTEQFTDFPLNSVLNVTPSQQTTTQSSTFTITKPQYVELLLTGNISSEIMAGQPGAKVNAQIIASNGTVIGSLQSSGSSYSGDTYFSLLNSGIYTLKIFTNVPATDVTNSNDHVYISSTVNYSKSLGQQSFNQMVGGLRIKSILNYDGVNPQPINDRYFTYADAFVISPIDSLNDYLTAQDKMTVSPSTASCNYRRITRNTSTKYSLGSIQGGIIGYGTVTTQYGLNGSNGKSISQFSNESDNGTLNASLFPYPPTDPREWRRGLLLNQTDYSTTQKVKEITNNYSFQFKTQVINFASGYSILYDPSLCTTIYHYCGVNAPPFNISSEQVFLNNSTETAYNSIGTGSTSTSTNYFYDSPQNTKAVRIETTNSKGETLKQYNRTALELADINASIPLTTSATSAINTMLSRNIVAVPVESETYNGNSIVSKLLINYQTSSNNIVPLEIVSQDGTNPTQSRLLLPNYDTYGNLLDQQKTAGPVASYHWGYSNQYPIASAVNASSTEFYFEGFEENAATGTVAGLSHTGAKYNTTATVSWTKPNSRTYIISYWYLAGGVWKFSGEQPYISNSFSMQAASGYDDIRIYPSDAQLSTYTYEPLIGMTTATDPKGLTTYYEYDSFLRLINVKDQNGNIVKHTDYHYKGQ